MTRTKSSVIQQAPLKTNTDKNQDKQIQPRITSRTQATAETVHSLLKEIELVLNLSPEIHDQYLYSFIRKFNDIIGPHLNNETAD